MNETLIILAAFAASAYGALVGFGGGVFVVPILVLLFGYPIEYAIGAVALSLVPSTLLTTVLNNKERHVDFKTGLVLELPSVAGVIFGSSLVAILPRVQIEYIFVITIFIVGMSFLRRNRTIKAERTSFLERMNARKPTLIRKDKKGHFLYQINYFLAIIFGILAGGLAGLLGVGGGFLKTPIMIRIFKIPVHVATGTALFMILLTSITSSVSHVVLGHVLFTYSWPVLIGFVIGPFLAARIKKQLSAFHLEKLVGISLLLAAAAMLVNIIFMHI